MHYLITFHHTNSFVKEIKTFIFFYMLTKQSGIYTKYCDANTTFVHGGHQNQKNMKSNLLWNIFTSFYWYCSLSVLDLCVLPWGDKMS